MIRTLSCHCGKIRLETNAELGEVNECNCSTCAKLGFIAWYVDRERVRLATPRQGISTYIWRFADEGAHFCPQCGATMFRTGPDSYFALNARCIDGVDIHALKKRQSDNLRPIPGGDVPPLADSA